MSKSKKLNKTLILATIFTHITNFKMQKYFNPEISCDLKILSVLGNYIKEVIIENHFGGILKCHNISGINQWLYRKRPVSSNKLSTTLTFDQM